MDGDGTDQTHLLAGGAADVHSGLGDTGGHAVSGDDNLGVLDHVLLHLNVLLPGSVQSSGLLVLGLHLLGVPLTGLDPGAVGVVQLMAGAGPLGLGCLDGGDLLVTLHLGQLNGLHHGADDAVSQNEDGVVVAVSVVESGIGQVNGLLHGGGLI